MRDTTHPPPRTTRHPATPTGPDPAAPSPSPELDRRGRLLRRYRHLPPWLVVVQLFFGLGWLRAAGEKVIAVDWWTGDQIRALAAEHVGTTLPWFQPVLDLVVGPAAPAIALAVLVAELAIGAALVVDRRVGPALAAAIVLNLSFLAAGAVNPSAFYLIGQGAIALWLLGRCRPTATLSRVLQLLTGAAVSLAAVSVPFIATLHPSTVIDDPAVMLVLLGGLTAVAAELTHRALFRQGLP